jgi:4-amino-4-deoxy-L-arabinose transferase-like glycosyltransferase
MVMKREAVWIIVALMIIAFMFRIGSFKREHPLSYDESVYPKLAVQIMNNPADYNTMDLYQVELKRGRKLPTYFTKPLFKHPPLFTYLVSFSFRILGRTYYSAFKVSLLFGVLLIGLAYLLGKTLFDEKTGIYAALIMLIEPMSWITSQKIWMETTLAFFSVLSICLFAMAVKRYNPYVMIAGGISAGLAALTKYPGILPIGGIVVYAACFDRWLFRKKSFYAALAAPFLVMLPWALWNYNVYGAELFTNIQKDGNVGRFFANLGRFQEPLWGLVFIVILLIVGRKKIFTFIADVSKKRGKIVPAVLVFGFLGILAILFGKYILNAFNFNYIPPTGWRTGMFNKEPWGFYPWKILELSPLYIFSYVSLAVFLFDRQKHKEYLFLFVFSLVLMTFWVAWGAYQCRYIVALAVPLVVLSAKAQFYILDKFRNMPAESMKLILQGVYLVFIAYLIIKTLRVDLALAVPNTACYF